MTLDAVAQYTNVERSIEEYIKDSVLDVDIDFYGLKFKEKDKTEWIRPRITSIDAEYIGRASASEYGESADVYLVIDCFTKKGHQTVADRHYELRDIVSDYFKIGEDIFVRGYAPEMVAGTIWADPIDWTSSTEWRRNYELLTYTSLLWGSTAVWVAGTIWGGSSFPKLARMRVREIIIDSPMPETQNLYRYSIGWRINYTRITSND